MKLHVYLLLSHFVVTTIAACAIVLAIFLGDQASIIVCSTITILSTAAASVVTGRRLKHGLVGLQSVVSDYQSCDKHHTGLQEFDQLARGLAQSARHWESVAAAARDQAGEFQTMMSLLDRREQAGASSQQLRGVLVGLGHTISAFVAQIEQGAAEIEQFAKSMTEGADSQGHAVIKTTTYVEQLATTIDAVSVGAANTQSTLRLSGESATSALRLVNELNQGMQRVQVETQSCEKKLKGLCDPTRQITAIVESISDIAARTNLLALNASIESIRAGEHGRGFALVADEVRNLAEQAAEATREITSLVDSVQLVTQESIRGIVREREQIETAIQRAANAEQALRHIVNLANDTRAIEQIAESSAQQLQLAQDVILTVEQISRLAKTHRSSAENVGWTVKTLASVNPQLRAVTDRLRQCGGEEATRENRSSAIPANVATFASAPALTPVG